MATKPVPGTLDGFPCLDSGVEWTFRHGVTPPFKYFELSRDHADELLKGKIRPVTLAIGGLEIKNLLILCRAPTSNPNTARVLVTDRRWYWQHIIIDEGFNQRRHIGVKRVGGAAGIPVLDPVVPAIDYEPWSMKNQNSAWKPKDLLDSITKEVLRLERRAGLNLGSFNVAAQGVGQTVEIENLNLSGPASSAIQQVLNYLPGLRLAIDADGTARFYSIAKGGKDELDKITSEFWDEGSVLANFTELNRVRPREIHVLFDIEAEVRFDFEESIDTTRTVGDVDERVCRNVLPITDFQLNHVGGQLTQGTWAQINKFLFEAWKTLPNTDTQMSGRLLRGNMVPRHDFFWNAFVRAGLDSSEADWASRFQALKMNWRQTFQLPRRWVDRYRRVHAYRVATRDPATGTRAPAMSWFDYFVVGTQRLVAAGNAIEAAAGGGGRAYGFNVPILGAAGVNVNLDSFKNAMPPSELRIIDHDQGVFKIDMVADKFRVKEVMMPGKVLNIPGDDDLSHLGMDAYSNRGARMEFDGDFSAVFLLTLEPGTAPQKRHLFNVLVRPPDVRPLLPAELASGLSNADGPIMEIKIGAGIETARLAWSDRYADKIDAIFSRGNNVSQADKNDLCVNYDNNNVGASLVSIARAAAAAVYAGYADRHQGVAMTDQVSDMKLNGLIEQFSQLLEPDSVAATQISMENWQDFSIDRQAFMTAGTRRFVNKIAGVNK